MDLRLSQEEIDIQRRTRDFVKRVVSPMVEEFESGRGSPRRLMEEMGRHGLFRLLVPLKYGGMYEKVRCLPICVAREELARGYNYAGACIATQGLGAIPIYLAGDEEQKSHFLPKLATGELIGAFALTEPLYGSDAASIEAQAKRQDSIYVLDGKKRFISNAGICDFYVVFAKTRPELGARGMSAFVVDSNAEGLGFRPMRILCYDVLGELTFNGVEVPGERLLGEEGRGFKIAMMTLDVLRATVGAHAVGTAQAALDEALRYADERVQFGRPLLEHQAIQFMLADMAVEVSAGRLLVYQAATAYDQGDAELTIKSSMAKMYATEMAQRVVDMALQIHGGNGLVVKDYPMERLYREVRSPRVYEGTTQIQKLIIANRLIKGLRESKS
jgi:acyl-CoA dehydrogenase